MYVCTHSHTNVNIPVSIDLHDQPYIHTSLAVIDDLYGEYVVGQSSLKESLHTETDVEAD